MAHGPRRAGGLFYVAHELRMFYAPISGWEKMERIAT